MPLLRLYLQQCQATAADDIIDDAVLRMEPGAVCLVRLVMQVRGNRRTRRKLRDVFVESRKQVPAAWYNRLKESVMQLFRVMRTAAFPAGGSRVIALQSHITRQTRRQLRWTRAVQVEVAGVSEEAKASARQLWAGLKDSMSVLWLDNWYWERYGTDPAVTNLSQNVSCMAVMVLQRGDASPAGSIRSRRFPPFPGHRRLGAVTASVDWVAARLATELPSLQRKVTGIVRDKLLTRAVLRVPLDVSRQGVVSLPWTPLSLTPLRVSSNDELLRLLGEIADIQRHVQQPLPLLVDEKIHYAVCRFMYSKSYVNHNVASWLGVLPVLYGVWHPYKHTLHVLYRTYQPLLALLECTGIPATGSTMVTHRKVLYLEKLYAALLLAAPVVQDAVESKLAAMAQPGSHLS